MLSSSLCSSLVALVASAIAVSATPGLTVWTWTSNPDVYGLENLRVTTTITNTGNETLKLLNDPRGVLDSFPENTFSITDPIGSRPEFVGAKVKFSPEYAAGLDDPSSFTVLTPGASIDVAHDLSAAYDFTLSGPGQYSIEASNLFTYVDGDGTLKDVYANAEDAAEVKLSGSLAISRVHDQRIGFVGCSTLRQQQIRAAAVDAQTYARNAYTYMGRLSSGRPRYATWFGAYTQARKNTVTDHFRLISSRAFASFTYNCNCNKPNVYAYVYPGQFGDIYLCGAFWRAPATGSDSRAGTLVHESSHFTINGRTSDFVYGVTAARNLARNDPAKAIMNADNHEYFAVNIPDLPFYPGDLPLGALNVE